MFEYLRKYLGASPPTRGGYNIFVPVSLAEIESAEDRLGYKFPRQLRHFYQVIGHGKLVGDLVNDDRGPLISNEVLHPAEVVDVREGASRYPYPFKFGPGELPFFRSWHDKYLRMDAKSSKPGRIYYARQCTWSAKDLNGFVRDLLASPTSYEQDISAAYRRQDALKARKRKVARKKATRQ